MLGISLFCVRNQSAALTESQKNIQQEYLQLSCHVNKSRRQIQECKLSCAEKDEVLAKVLEDRERTLKNKLSGFAKKKLQ
ncbi:UNVERIFIED_CONTAM: hypothetical protein K2H54_049290 [Gekko kuhli]